MFRRSCFICLNQAIGYDIDSGFDQIYWYIAYVFVIYGMVLLVRAYKGSRSFCPYSHVLSTTNHWQTGSLKIEQLTAIAMDGCTTDAPNV
jgi:hypothetical protein